MITVKFVTVNVVSCARAEWENFGWIVDNHIEYLTIFAIADLEIMVWPHPCCGIILFILICRRGTQ